MRAKKEKESGAAVAKDPAAEGAESAASDGAGGGGGSGGGGKGAVGGAGAGKERKGAKRPAATLSFDPEEG